MRTRNFKVGDGELLRLASFGLLRSRDPSCKPACGIRLPMRERVEITSPCDGDDSLAGRGRRAEQEHSSRMRMMTNG